MTWSYSGDPEASVKDELRYTIGDTIEDMPLMQDEELEYQLRKCNQQVLPAAIECCQRLSAKFAQQVNYSIGPESVSAGDRAKAFHKLAQDLQKELMSTNALPYGSPLDTTQSIFSVGFMDNRGGDPLG